MLILTRRLGETIRINDDISVTITGINRMPSGCTTVRVGVQAPNHVEVHREEVYIRIQDEKKSSLNQD